MRFLLLLVMVLAGCASTDVVEGPQKEEPRECEEGDCYDPPTHPAVEEPEAADEK